MPIPRFEQVALAPDCHLTAQVADLVCGEVLGRVSPPAEAVESELRPDGERYYAIVEEEKVIAAGALADYRDGVQISYLVTHPERRGQNLGHWMLKELEHVAAGLAGRLYAYVSPEADQAMRHRDFSPLDPDARTMHGSWYYKNLPLDAI